MLVLLIEIAGQLYCIRARSVVEVIPRVPLQPVPHAPMSLAGLLHYRSEVIPVLDLRAIIARQPSDAYLSTRIAVVDIGKRLGLVCERLTEALEIDEAAIAPAPVSLEAAPWLGGVLMHDGAVARELLIEHFTVEAVA
ncbi:MAG TPA: chemotaxis protein CheW [Thermoanaerobaculia bacterium]|nr:chemotaxis protein CheW [Thermoanaerobaculia bacterium]